MLCSRLQLSPIQGFLCFLRHCSVLGLDCSIYKYIYNYILFVTSLFYLLRASVASLSVCYVIALFSSSAVSSSIYCVTTYQQLFVCCVTALFSASIAPSSVCYITILFLQGFHCFIICLLRHCSVLGFDCFIFCLLCHYPISSSCRIFLLFHCILRHYTISSRFPLFHYLFVTCSLRHCSFFGFDCSIFCLLRNYTISSRFSLFRNLFATSLLCSRLQLSPLLFVAALYTSSSLHCFVICVLLHCSVLGFDCFIFCLLCHPVSLSFLLFHCLLRHHTISSRFPLFHYLFVKSLLFFGFDFPSSVCYATILFLQGFHCSVIYVLRH